MQDSGVRIVRFRDVEPSDAVTRALDDIFFGASGTKSFASAAARADFRWRWLGRYLQTWPEDAFLAIGADEAVTGYLIGSMVDPASDRAVRDLSYVNDFADLSRDYPAHLHINLAPHHRSAGTGARLVETFCTHAAAKRAPGLHVVTGQGMRNVGFYLRNGFEQAGATVWKERTLLFLARRL